MSRWKFLYPALLEDNAAGAATRALAADLAAVGVPPPTKRKSDAPLTPKATPKIQKVGGDDGVDNGSDASKDATEIIIRSKKGVLFSCKNYVNNRTMQGRLWQDDDGVFHMRVGSTSPSTVKCIVVPRSSLLTICTNSSFARAVGDYMADRFQTVYRLPNPWEDELKIVVPDGLSMPFHMWKRDIAQGTPSRVNKPRPNYAEGN